METVKNVVASVNEGVAAVAGKAAEALGTVQDKVSCPCIHLTAVATTSSCRFGLKTPAAVVCCACMDACISSCMESCRG